jgi:hypothetical protein
MLLKWILVVYKIIILPIALYGCETWSLALREGHRLRAFVNRVLGWECLDRRGIRYEGPGEKCVMRIFITCTPHQILPALLNHGGSKGQGI